VESNGTTNIFQLIGPNEVKVVEKQDYCWYAFNTLAAKMYV